MNQGEALLAPPALPTERIAHLGGRRLLRCGISIRPMSAWVNLDTFGRGDAAIHVRYASNTDRIDVSQQNVAMCH